VEGEAAFIRDGQTMYELFAYTSADRYQQRRGTLLDILSSFARLKDPRDLRVEPQRIRLRDSGVVPDQLDELALMNHLLLEDRITAGTLLKTVTRPAVPIATSNFSDDVQTSRVSLNRMSPEGFGDGVSLRAAKSPSKHP